MMKNFNKDFKVFKDTESFWFRGINLSKYFYDLYVSRTSLGDQKISTTRNRNQHKFLNKPYLVITGFLRWLRIIVYARHKVFFFGSENRTIVEEGTRFDLYNYNIIRALGHENVIIIQDRHDNLSGKIFPPDLIMDDLAPGLFLLERALGLFLRKELLGFQKRLAEKIGQFGFSRKDIAIKLLKFYSRYLFYLFFMRVIKPKSAFLICHYSKHAFIAACKTLNIPSIELQHGNLSKANQFYFTEDRIFNNASLLITDYFASFGKYWKDIISKGHIFKENNIFILGYYLFDTIAEQKVQKSGKNLILITSQPPVQAQIIQYIEFLRTVLDPNIYQIVIKPHPTENDKAFNKLISPGFVSVEYGDVYNLLQLAKIHISVYSMTLFEALRYPLMNYCLYINAYKDQCNEIIASGAAKRLDMNEIPSICMDKKTLSNPKPFFEDYDKNIPMILKIAKNRK